MTTAPPASTSRFIDLDHLGDPSLALDWAESAPFPHVVLDDFLRDGAGKELFDALCDEALQDLHDEIYDCEATATAVTHPVLRAFHDELTSEPVLARLRVLTGKALTRCDLRGFVYRAGHYLLPHSDHQESVGRAIAFALYLDAQEAIVGGELELFACTREGDEIVATMTASLIEPAPSRVVLFEVGETSLHQIREVTAGVRVSLSGWFYP